MVVKVVYLKSYIHKMLHAQIESVLRIILSLQAALCGYLQTVSAYASVYREHEHVLWAGYLELSAQLTQNKSAGDRCVQRNAGWDILH